MKHGTVRLIKKIKSFDTFFIINSFLLEPFLHNDTPIYRLPHYQQICVTNHENISLAKCFIAPNDCTFEVISLPML